MIPHITRGGDTSRLLLYLVGPGRGNEHEDPRLVSGSPEAIARHGHNPLPRSVARELAAYLDEPMNLHGTKVSQGIKDATTGKRVGWKDAHVWHCSLALAPDEPALSDEQWAVIAEKFMASMAFDAGAGGDSPLHWVAVRHGQTRAGGDHIHLVVNLVHRNGRVANLRDDFKRAQRACMPLEREYGLRVVDGRERRAGERQPSAGALEADRRRGRDVGPTIRTTDGGERLDPMRWEPEGSSQYRLELIVRACGVAAETEADFVRGLRREGVLVRPRFEKGSQTIVAGYSVALRGVSGEGPVWYGGGRLSRDLTLPRLRESWEASPAEIAAGAWRGVPEAKPKAIERLLAIEQCAVQLADMVDQLQAVPAGERATWAQVARDTAGVLAAWSVRLEARPGVLAQASRSLARTAQVRRPETLGRRWLTLPPARGAASFLMSSDAVRHSMAGLLEQLTRIALTIRDMHIQEAEEQRAHEVEMQAVGLWGERQRQLAAAARGATLALDVEQRGLSAGVSSGRTSPGRRVDPQIERGLER